MAFEDYYLINPISVVDQNLWDDKVPEVILNFQRGPTIYTPLIDWVDQSRQTGAATSVFTDLLEGDVDNDAIDFDAQYIPVPAGVDSRQRKLTTKRYGDKVQYAKDSDIFQMWKMSGGRDWRPLLRGLLGNNVRRKLEILARNAHLLGPKSYWTYAGGALDFSDLSEDNKFSLGAVNAWNLRLGNIGTPIIPGESASAKLAIVPPGVIYDFQESLAGASPGEAQMWRDASLYKDKLQYEIGVYKNIRFVEVPNDTYGQNSAILYNAGPIAVQAEVSSAIGRGDGCPHPETDDPIDGVWYVGQKDVNHFIQLAAGTDMSLFELNDQVSIHTQRTNAYGVVGGVNILSGRTIVRRIVDIDVDARKLCFDRPIMTPYTVNLGTSPAFYAYVTKGTHVAFNLVLGSRGGIKGNVNKPLAFYEPKPVDDFESVWRYVWDIIAGYNIWEPSLFECHFTAVTVPKPGGVIAPPAAELGSG